LPQRFIPQEWHEDCKQIVILRKANPPAARHRLARTSFSASSCIIDPQSTLFKRGEADHTHA